MPWGQMIDAVDVAAIPVSRGVKEVAGYVDGDYQTFPEVVSIFGRWATCVPITTQQAGSLGAWVYDRETGDGDARGAAAWALRKLRIGFKLPVIYCNLSSLPEVVDAVGTLRIPGHQVGYWVADWTGHPHTLTEVGANVVAVQYASFHNGTSRDVDYSQTSKAWPPRPTRFLHRR